MLRVAALAVIAVLGNPAATWAQNSPSPGNPAPGNPAVGSPRVPEDKQIAGLVTPQRVASEMEATAKRLQDSGRAPATRGRSYYFSWSSTTPAEFDALARHNLFLFSIWTQQADGMPVKRIYVRADGKELPLLKVSSWNTPVDGGSITAKMFGSYREDGFYLVPGGAMLRKGEVVLDHGNQAGWVMMELPSNVAVADVNHFANTDPPPNAKPNLRALQGLIQRRFPGFPVPKSLP